MAGRADWRVGFEVEVVLGTLGQSRFEEWLQEGGMDQASPAYCQAVATALRDLTGHPWTAPRKQRKAPGYFVMPEYDLDPLNFPHGIVAGVELITPPLPLAEAEELRDELIDAVSELDDFANGTESLISANAGWHLNVDAPGLCMNPDAFALAADEVPLLSQTGRLGNGNAAPQRHAIGIPLLRLLRDRRGAAAFTGAGLTNLIEAHLGRSKRYAANFGKLQSGYLELRHHGALSFFNGAPLSELLAPLTAPLELDRTQIGRCEEPYVQRLRTVSRWLDSISADLSFAEPSGRFVPAGGIYFREEKIGHYSVNGLASVHLLDGRTRGEVSVVRDVDLPDLELGVALACWDLAQLRAVGIKTGLPGSASFRTVLRQLSDELRAMRPVDWGPPVWAGGIT